MTRTHFRTALMAAVSVVALACDSSTSPRPAAEGSWGGAEASLTLSAAGGALTFQCGSGVVQSGWTLTNDGIFTAAGTYTFAGGPVPPGGFQSHPARFSGKISGSTLTLTVAVLDLQQALGPYRLTRGGPDVTPRCN